MNQEKMIHETLKDTKIILLKLEKISHRLMKLEEVPTG